MKRRTSKAAERAKKKAAREAGMKNPGGASKYARKHAYCLKHGVWGFEVSNPKPWKKSTNDVAKAA
jgi:hypothetical protein